MADSKLADLTALAAIAGDELLYVVDDPAGTPLDRKVTIADLLAAGPKKLLASSVLGSSAATIDFTSIPATYEDLELVITGRGTHAATGVALNMRFNGSSSSIYDAQRITGGGVTTTSAEAYAGSSGEIAAMPAATATANKFSQAVVRIARYARGGHKLAVSWGGRFDAESSGNGWIEFKMILWRSTAAINQITLLPGSGSFDTGTVVTLYGTKGP